jgi:7-carboxy-7-deazaguanine synthase
MKVSEIFHSIQGEGIYMGLPMSFIRVTGCNLKCKWCDTKYAYTEGFELSLNDIIERLRAYPCNNVCLTGGEPMIQKEMPVLVKLLIKNGFTVYLETNGSVFLGALPKSKSLYISMDIKCPSCGEEQKMNFTNLEILGEGDQVKFIIADDEDYEYAKEIMENHPISRKCEVIFQSCAIPPGEDDFQPIAYTQLVERVMMDGLSVRVLPQLHKLIWPDRLRGV